MSTNRDWKEFNNTWRDRAGEKTFDAIITALGQFIFAAEGIIKRLEPFGILLAAMGLVVSIIAFQIDYRDRTVERKFRAWEIASAAGPSSGGKIDAVELLLRNGNDISGAQIAGSHWILRDLSGANLNRTNLSNAMLNKTDFRRADLSRANLSGADLSGADLRKALLAETNLSKAFLGAARIGSAFLANANLSKADLSYAFLSRANLTEADLSGAILEGAKLSMAILSGANLSHANLAGADLQNANLDGSDLSGADLSAAKLDGVYLFAANLSGTDLTYSKGIEQELLVQACGDADTKLSDGLVIPMCTEVYWFTQVHGED